MTKWYYILKKEGKIIIIMIQEYHQINQRLK